jgi:GNAT superfamily N-acetyltransferase
MIGLSAGYSLQDGADAVVAHAFLTESYWAKGTTLDTVQRSIVGSICVSVWFDGIQVGMARVISDRATFAYLTDVYVVQEHQGKGLAQAMLTYLLGHPELQELGRWALFTKDAQSLYARFGWAQYPMPERMMVIDNRLCAS